MKKWVFIVFIIVHASGVQAQKTILFEENFKNKDARWSVTSTEHAVTSIAKGKYIYEKKTAGNIFS